MKVFDSMIKYNTILILFQKILGLLLPIFFWIFLSRATLLTIAPIILIVLVVRTVAFGLGKSLKKSLLNEARVGNHKYEFYVFAVGIIVYLLLAVGSLFLIPSIFLQLGVVKSNRVGVELFVLLLLLSKPVKVYLETKRKSELIMIEGTFRIILALSLMLGSILIQTSSTFAVYLSWVLFTLYLIRTGFLVLLSIEVYPEQKFKITYEDSGKYKEVHKLVFEVLLQFVWMSIIVFAIGWILLQLGLQMIQEYEFFLVVLLPFILGIVELILLFTRSKMCNLDDTYAHKNYSGLDKLIQFTNLFVLLIGLPLTVFGWVFARELQTVFALSTLAGSATGLLLFLLPVIFVNIWFVMVIEKTYYIVIGVILGTSIQILFMEYLSVLYGVAGYLMSLSAAMLFLWILLLFVLNQFVGFEWNYFLRKIAVLLGFAIGEVAFLIAVKYLLKQTMHFTTGYLQEWMMLGISMILLIVLVYALMITSGMVRLLVEEPLKKEELLIALEDEVLEELIW